MTDAEPSLVDVKIKRPWWRRKGPLAAIAAGAVVAALAIGIPVTVGKTARCAEGVEKLGERDECIGVTDGSFIFDQGLAEVERLIHEENVAVTNSEKPYVTVGFFVSMTLTDKDKLPIDWVRHHLQGAYLAQREANNDSSQQLPLIRILLANPGSRMAFWEDVVTELGRRRAAPDNLVAVAGVGLSLDTARIAMNRLSDLGLLTLGSTITSDDMKKLPNLLRMAPTNSGQARAAAAYIKSKATTALLVQDQSPQDLYAATLASAFTENFADQNHHLVGQTEFYDSSKAAVGNQFMLITPNICNSKPEVVYFAGRGDELSSFIGQLTKRDCKKHPITVLAGDDVSTGLNPDSLRAALASGIEIVFTATAHPAAWESAPSAFDATALLPFTDRICTYCFPERFKSDSLDDGSAIMAYDAVVTAVKAIRLSADDSGNGVTAESVLQMRNRLHDVHAVNGASGRLSFDHEGTPTQKAVPIMRLREDGRADFLHLSSS